MIRVAEPYLGLVECSSGRLDDFETTTPVACAVLEAQRAQDVKARLVPRYLTSREFRLAFTSGVSANIVCFERELLDRFRLVVEK